MLCKGTPLAWVFDFLHESNTIEGINRGATPAESEAFMNFMEEPTITVARLCGLQYIFAPGMPLRDRQGENVRVGNYSAPPGGPQIKTRLENILHQATTDDDPWKVHCKFEMLHPFMDGNGHTGRMLWAWHMGRIGQNPFALPFLHRFYYQTLEHGR